MGEITLAAERLTKTYTDARKNRTTVFKNLSVSFEKGKLYAVFGPSGSGKSSLLRLLGIMDRPTAGEVSVMGQKTAALTEDQMADLRRDRIGFVFQNHFLNPRLTVLENMILPLRINKAVRPSDYAARSRELLGLFGVEQFFNRYPSEISGGEQQRVCIARSLANSPDIILADEPTGNLDGGNEKSVLGYLKSLTAQDRTVVVVTHNEEVRNYADVVFCLKEGELFLQSGCTQSE